MQPKRLSKNEKKQLLTDCIKSGCVTDISQKHNVTRKTVYDHINKISEAIDQTLSEPDDVLFYIPVTWKYIAMVVLLLFIICKSSIRNIVTFLKYSFDIDVSVGKVSSILDEATVKAKLANDSYRFENCKNSATDELFHQGNPVLAAIDRCETWRAEREVE